MCRNLSIAIIIISVSVAIVDGGRGLTLKNATARTVIKIGALFEPDCRGQALALRYAVEEINTRLDLLYDVRLECEVQEVQPQDSFISSLKVCRQLKDGVAAIFGPTSSLSVTHVQSICQALEVPHVQTQWDFQEDGTDTFSINLYPHPNSLNKAYLDFITSRQWTAFTILYQTNDGLIRLQELLKVPLEKSNQFHITIRQLEAEEDGDYRMVLKEMKNRGEFRMIIDCDYRLVRTLLKQAMSLGMMNHYYHYLLTTLDISLVDLDDFKYDGTNITAFRLVNPHSDLVAAVLAEWTTDEQKLAGLSPIQKETGIRTDTALAYDAVHLFAASLQKLLYTQPLKTSPLHCESPKPYDHGMSLLNVMKMTQTTGLTGRVMFDNLGRRSVFDLDLVELTKEGLDKIATWNPLTGLNVTKDYESEVKEVKDILTHKTLIVTTILEDPYVMDRGGNFTGNERYEGYCVDLLNAIAKQLKFNYTIQLVADNTYGVPEGPDRIWSGMIGELINRKADLAVAPLTITYAREEVIDFTKPFLNLGISILFKKPDKPNPQLFSFLSPLSFEIWIYMLAAYMIVSFMLFVLARFSPYEWVNPHPCKGIDSDVLENQFTLLNSLWFTVGSLMQQGSEVSPRATSTRIVSGIWWFFTLILISSYTANLAAFLTVERMASPIESADDLTKQVEIKYGTLARGSSMTFFKNSTIPVYQKMWHFMEMAKPSVFVNSTKRGIERVKNEKYAFLLESTMNEFFTQRECDLMQVGGLLDSKGYGIGTPPGSPYRDLISSVILKLQEDQIMQNLFDTWWKEWGGAGKCNPDDKGKKNVNALAIDNVGGVFVVLCAGLVLSLVVAVVEFAYKTSQTRHPSKTLGAEMMEELAFALRCCGASKKVARRKTWSNAQSLGDVTLNGTSGTLNTPLTSYHDATSHNHYQPPCYEEFYPT